jgi:hypothetical protein
MRRRRWPWVVAAACLVIFVASNVVYPEADSDPVWTTMFAGIIAAFVLVGALLCVRVPNNPIGLVILGSGVSLTATVAVGMLAVIATDRGNVPTELITVAALVNDIGFIMPIVVVLIGVPLIFPDGRLLSPRWRWIVVLCVAALTATALAQLLGPGPIGTVEIANPFYVPALAPLVDALDAFSSWSSIIGFGAAALAVVIRYRRGDDVARHQLKWLIAVAVVAAIAFPFSFIFPGTFAADIAFLVGLLALLALPLVIAIAILRYRLYDIDRIVSRTISWTVVTGVLVAVFAIVVIALQGLLVGLTQGQTLAVAASTLVAFACFQPIRRRVQRAVDERFDRASVDAQRTADAFAERLRDEVDLESLTGELERTVVGVIRPTAAALWLPGRDPR